MALSFRNVQARPSDDVRTWPYEALVTALERGLVHDWQPIFAEIRSEPWGLVARRIEHYLSYADQPAVASLFQLAIARARDRREREEGELVAGRVRESIKQSGLSRDVFASRIGTSSSRLSTYATGRVVPSAAMLVRIEAAAQSDRTPRHR